MTRYLGGSLAMRVKSLASSLNVGLIFSSIIQPAEKKHLKLCISTSVFVFPGVTSLTFNHNHVDIYGTDVRLGQSLALLQQTWHFLRLHRRIRLLPEWHHFPHCHPCPGKDTPHIKPLPVTAAFKRTVYLKVKHHTHTHIHTHNTHACTQPLTITPNITLMSVSSKQDAFKCHPFNGCLDEDRNCSQVMQNLSITEQDTDKWDSTIHRVSHSKWVITTFVSV